MSHHGAVLGCGVLLLVVAGQASAPSSSSGGAPLPCLGETTTADILNYRNLSGAAALITGGASGLGNAAALALCMHGADVILADDGWNATAGEAAANEMNAIARNVPGAGSATFMPLDLSKFASVRALAARVLESELGGRLSIVINNAAGGSTSGTTPDGFNEKFEIDYLGPFLLTELLLPALRRSAAAHARGDGPTRAVVVNVASDVHLHACETAGWEPGCFGSAKYLPLPSLPPAQVTVHYPDSNYTDTESNSLYGACKLLQIQHAAELAKRESAAAASAAEQVWALSVHPGSCGSCCGTTGSAGWHNMSRQTWDKICDVTYRQMPPYPCPFSAAQGAAVYLYAALDAPVSGVYHSRVTGCGPSPVNENGFTPSLRAELYDQSRRWLNLSVYS